MNIEIADILLIHASFLSINLLRCNKSLATLINREDVIQTVKRLVFRWIAREASLIPYYNGATCGYDISMRKFKNRIWQASSFEHKELEMCTRFIAIHPLDPRIVVPIRCESFADKPQSVYYHDGWDFCHSVDKRACRDAVIIANSGWAKPYHMPGFEIEPSITSKKEMDIIYTSCFEGISLDSYMCPGDTCSDGTCFGDTEPLFA